MPSTKRRNDSGSVSKVCQARPGRGTKGERKRESGREKERERESET